MQILVIGGSGFLGTYVTNCCVKMHHTAVGTSTNFQMRVSGLIGLDISNMNQILQTVESLKPDCVINCAAITDVDECERQPKKAELVNSIGPKNLAEISADTNIRLIQVSTDAIFDGKHGSYSEDSSPNPINTYAKTKLEGERFVSSIAENYAIVRTNFYGLNPNGKGLLNWILKSLAEKREITGFEDVVFNPLWAADLAECLLGVAQMSYIGILNCSGNQILSKYEFAKAVATNLGYNNSIIKRSSSYQAPSLIARRPKKTYLDNTRMRELLKNTKIHTIEEVLRDPSFDIYRRKTT